MMFPKDALDFYAGVSRLAARARERGDLEDLRTYELSRR
jgi:hypothetical protein